MKNITDYMLMRNYNINQRINVNAFMRVDLVTRRSTNDLSVNRYLIRTRYSDSLVDIIASHPFNQIRNINK